MEVRYENFISNPLETINALYKQFNLQGYHDIEPSLKTYLATQKTVRMDNYTFDDSVKKRVENHWGFALKEYQYSHPQEEKG